MRAQWICVVGLAGCYSPSAPHGVPCAPGAGPDRCPAGQECVVRGGVEVCEPPGATGDPEDAAVDAPGGDGPGADAMPDGGGIPAGWWNTSYTLRRPIDIAAGANGVPAGYSIAIAIDHASFVGAGQSLANGDDVRIVEDGASSDLDRVLDTGAAWNTAATKLWFRSATAIPANQTRRFWVYYGNGAAAGAPASAGVVFLLADGFEGGLGAWDVDALVGTSTQRAHLGSRAAQVSPHNADVRGMTSTTLDERDIVVDVWWNIEDNTNLDCSQGARSKNNFAYYTNLQTPGPAWDISATLDGTYTELVPPPLGAAAPPTNTWFRVTTYLYADQMAIDVGGARYVPASGFSSVGSMTTGAVFLDCYNLQQRVWWDDLTARRYVLPEPAVAVGAPQSI